MDASCFNTTKNNTHSPQLFSTVRKHWPDKQTLSPPAFKLTSIQSSNTPKLADFLAGQSELGIKKSPGNLATQLNYDSTPFQKQPVPNKNLHKTPHELYTTCYDDAEESFQVVSKMISEEQLLKRYNSIFC